MSPPPVTVAEAYQAALAHHQAGRLDAADALYRQILAVAPEHADALHLLGVIEHQRGRHVQAAELVARALAIQPANPPAHSNLGEIHKALGRWEQAQACHERALALDPRFADAHNNLGTVHLHGNRLEEARRCFETAAALQPGHLRAHYNLGVVCGRLRRYDLARTHYERALALRPDLADTHMALGGVAFAQDRLAASLVHFQRAVALQGDHAEAHAGVAGVLAENLRFGEALGWAERALALNPTGAGHASVAFSQKELGRLDEALAHYRRAVDLQPLEPKVHSNLIHALHFHPATTGEDVRAECARWNARHVAPLRAGFVPHGNDPDPERRLRVGYVSPDFRDHAVSHFIAPLLRAHDHAAFEVHGYASGLRSDAVTAHLRTLCDRWHEVGALDDAALAEKIRADGIDVLVELTLHTSDHRLLALARRPAPVQVSWLGYAGTSGLEGMDYRLTDPSIDPPDRPDTPWSAEMPVRLPDVWCCYEPAPDAPAVGPLPALGANAAGTVTFGSLNQAGKHHGRTLAVWARVLAAVPRSRLLLYHPDPVGQADIRRGFAAAGIADERLGFVGRLTKGECLQVYNELIDIGLDPFPHNGMTTTCEALWMGVPVVTLTGELPVARTGLSLLSTVGLGELAARDEDEYVRIATKLAGDLPRLAALRAGLRARMAVSPLLDAPCFARNVEAAFRAMWRQWCARPGPAAGESAG